MDTLGSLWLEFSLCAALVGTAGYFLSRYGDVIAGKTGLSGSWVGLVLLATVTSLPELATGVTAVTVATAPNIAVGDVLGSCVFNLAILVVVDLIHREEPVYRRASQGHILSGALGTILIGVAGLSVLLGPRAQAFAIAHVGAYTPLIILGYLAAVRLVFTYERAQLREFVAEMADRYPELTIRQAVARYALAATAVVAGGIWLPFLGTSIAEATGWHKAFVGTQFIAAATSLPELAVTIAAVRIGAVDMAVANLLGSNLFNMVVLAVDDLFYVPGPLLAHVSQAHAASAFSAMTMTGIAIVGLLYRPASRMFNVAGWVSLALLALYFLNSYVLFVYGA
jgi:cation:H+ antiporter